MFNPNTSKKQFKQAFIKNSPNMLQDIYGSENVIPYWVADSDFSVASPITKALQDVVDRGVYAYEFLNEDTYQAISDWNKKRHGLELNPKHFVQVTGVLTAIGLLLREFTQKEDAILIQTPAYHQFAKVINTAGRNLIKNPLSIVDNKYRLNFDSLEQQIKQHQVKALVFCNPHNPTGRVWNQEEIYALVSICEKHQVLIISDEIHSDIILVGHKFYSLTNHPYSNIISLIGSPAKTFGMQNISNGYIYTNNQSLLNSISELIDSLHLGGNNTFTEYATIAAFTHGHQWLDEFINSTQITLDWIRNYIAKEIPKLRLFQPEGTYQLWFDFSEYFDNSDTMIKTVGKEAGMGLTPGEWFSGDTSLFMRMNIASELNIIQESFYRLAETLNR